MTRLRCNDSDLRTNLFNRLMADSLLCDCGQMETDTHFFEDCNIHDAAREEAKNQVPDLTWNTQYIYHGFDNYDEQDNIKLQLAGQYFILKSGRFD